MQRPFHFPMIPACYHTRTKNPCLFSLSKHDFLSCEPVSRGQCTVPGVLTGHASSCPALYYPPDNSHRPGVMSAWHLVTERGRDSEERSELQERPSHDVPTLTFTVPVILLIWKHSLEKLELGLLWHLSFSLNPCLHALTVAKFQEKDDKLLCLPNRMKSHFAHLLFCVLSLQHLDSALHLQLRQFPTAWMDESQEKQESWQQYCKKLQKHAKSTQMTHEYFSQESTSVNVLTSYPRKQAAPFTSTNRKLLIGSTCAFLLPPPSSPPAPLLLHFLNILEFQPRLYCPLLSRCYFFFRSYDHPSVLE